MTDHKSGAISALSLGSGSVLAAQGVIIGLEKLSHEERLFSDRLVAAVRETGRSQVLVGAMRGHSAADLRPLLLETAPERGALTLVRLSEPAVGFSRSACALWEAAIAELRSRSSVLRSRMGVLSAGELDDRFWITRRFHPRMVVDGLRERAVSSPLTVCQRLIQTVDALHRVPLIHGHICINNVALHDGALILLDPLFAFECGADVRGKMDQSAPELQKVDVQPSEATDAWGLARTISAIIGQAAEGPQKEILQRMGAPDPAHRPSLAEVMDAFAANPRTSSGIHSQRGLRVVTPANQVRTGKVLSADDAVRVQPPLEGAVTDTAVSQAPPVVPVAPAAPSALPLNTIPLKPLSFPRISTRLRTLLVVGAIALVAVIYICYRPGFDDRLESYSEQWLSGDAKKMEQVARAAVKDRDEAAQFAIIKQAQGPKPVAEVRASLIRNAFRAPWENEYSARDRSVALRLALPSLLSQDTISLPKFQEVHPGVLLAVVADLPLALSEGEFDDVTLDVFSKLPPPHGMAFTELQRLKVKSFGEPPARALAHIVLGDYSEEVLRAYFSNVGDDEEFLGRLLVVVPFAELYPKFGSPLAGYLLSREDVFARRVEWFGQDPNVKWLSVPDSDKLQLVIAMMPQRPLLFEQYADLLTFPAARIRQDALAKLQQALDDARISDLLKVLGSEQNQLTRSQGVLLLSALQLALKQPKSDATFSFFARWFETQPDPLTVVALLVATSKNPQLAVFSIDGARYLTEKNWQATLDQLRTLSGHSEPLARALAYSRLDPAVPEEAQVLQAATKREQVPRLKQELLQKLRAAKDTPPVESNDALDQLPIHPEPEDQSLPEAPATSSSASEDLTEPL